MSEEQSLKNISNYVALSLTRVVETEDYDSELIHVSAVRFVNDVPLNYIDVYVENSRKKYNEVLNKKAFSHELTISALNEWISDDIIILHEGGRKDIEWLDNELKSIWGLSIKNQYINLEDLAIFNIGLKKTSLKNIAKHFGVYRLNTNVAVSRDAHNCMLIHEIWKAYKNS